MKQRDVFLLSDEALRSVVDRLTPAHLELAAPQDWSFTPNPTIRDILAAHVKDEAWVPDVLSGRTIEEVGDRYLGDVLGDDPIAAYDSANDLATAAVNGPLDPDAIVHLSYGDFPLSQYLEHVSIYRAFQAWSLAKHLGIEFRMSDALLDGLEDIVLPQLDDLRSFGVFPPEIEVPADSDRETKLLGRTGYWF